METLPATGKAPAMRADGLQESLLEDAWITSVLQHLAGRVHLLENGKGLCLLITWMFVLLESFWTNPQYRVKVDKLLSECSSSDNDKTMLVSLMQKPDKRNRRLVKNLHIGFSVFEANLTLCRFLWTFLMRSCWKDLKLTMCLFSFKVTNEVSLSYTSAALLRSSHWSC